MWKIWTRYGPAYIPQFLPGVELLRLVHQMEWGTGFIKLSQKPQKAQTIFTPSHYLGMYTPTATMNGLPKRRATCLAAKSPKSWSVISTHLEKALSTQMISHGSKNPCVSPNIVPVLIGICGFGNNTIQSVHISWLLT